MTYGGPGSDLLMAAARWDGWPSDPLLTQLALISTAGHNKGIISPPNPFMTLPAKHPQCNDGIGLSLTPKLPITLPGYSPASRRGEEIPPLSTKDKKKLKMHLERD